MPHQNGQIHKAIYYSLLMVLISSTVIVAARFAAETASTLAIVTVQYALCLLFCLPTCLRPGIDNLKTQRVGVHLVRSLAGVMGFFLFYAALSQIPLVDATLLRQSAPLAVPLVMLVWNRDRIPTREWLPLFVGFIGIVIILRPSADGLS